MNLQDMWDIAHPSQRAQIDTLYIKALSHLHIKTFSHFHIDKLRQFHMFTLAHNTFPGYETLLVLTLPKVELIDTLFDEGTVTKCHQIK